MNLQGSLTSPIGIRYVHVVKLEIVAECTKSARGVVTPIILCIEVICDSDSVRFPVDGAVSRSHLAWHTVRLDRMRRRSSALGGRSVNSQRSAVADDDLLPVRAWVDEGAPCRGSAEGSNRFADRAV